MGPRLCWLEGVPAWEWWAHSTSGVTDEGSSWSGWPSLAPHGIRMAPSLNMQPVNELRLFLFVILSATHYSHFFGIKKRRKKEGKKRSKLMVYPECCSDLRGAEWDDGIAIMLDLTHFILAMWLSDHISKCSQHYKSNFYNCGVIHSQMFQNDF